MLTGRGTALVAVAISLVVAGALAGVQEFLVLGSAIAFVVAVSVCSVLRTGLVARKSIRVQFLSPVSEVVVGENATARLAVTNFGQSQVERLLIEDPINRWSLDRPGLAPLELSMRGVDAKTANEAPPWELGARRAVPQIYPGRSWALTVQVPSGVRGLLTLSPVRVWAQDPFRVAAMLVSSAARSHVVVCPSPANTPAPPTEASASGRRDATAVEVAATVSRSEGHELSDLRAYRSGDRLSRLHWPALARTGDLVVREFVEPLGGLVAIFIDVRSEPAGTEAAERAIEAAARLGLEALGSGTDVEIRTTRGDGAVVRAISPGSPAFAPSDYGRDGAAYGLSGVPSVSSGGSGLLRTLALLPVDDARSAPVESDIGPWAAAHHGTTAVLISTHAGLRTAVPDVLRNRMATVLIG